MYYQRTLKNGIRVVGQKLEGFQSVSVGIWIRTGSVDEFDNESGISHFIEHMLFKGTSRRTAQQISAEMDSIGGILNAFTSKENTCYHARVTQQDLGKAMDILCDIVFNATRDPTEMEKEKGVVVEEISMVEDTPDDLVHDLLSEAYFNGHRLANPILGTQQSVMGFTREDLVQYMKRRYVSDEIVIVACGGFDFDALCDMAEKGSEGRAYIGESSEHAAPFVQTRDLFISREKPIEQVHFCLCLPGVAMDDEKLFALSVFNNAFGGSMSSSLFQKIREERGLAYDVYSHPSSYSNCGTFSIYAGVNPQRALEAMQVTLEELDDVYHNGITQEEFDRAKSQLRGNYILGLESTSSRMNAVGKNVSLIGELRTAEENIAGIDRVTKDAVDEIATTMMDRSKLSGSLVGNIDGQKFADLLKA